jgi:predicted 3-demethylubiquinone-9 3-methyltransferase (glyoxalase superfamily)
MDNFAVCLWFDGKAEEAANFYCDTFKNSRIGTITNYGEAGEKIPGRPDKGTVMTVKLELDGLNVLTLNGGPMFSITPAISMFVGCENAAEIDRLYAALTVGGSVLMPLQEYPFAKKYTWVQDRFGVSWQLILDPDKHYVVPCMLFTAANRGKAAEAIDFYIEQFPNSAAENIKMYPPSPEYPKAVKHAVINLNGQELRIMDANNDCDFAFNPAVSFIVYCKNQSEIDNMWNKLSAGGAEVQCGWLTDRYGVSWQIVPESLHQLIGEGDYPKSEQVMRALLKMTKLNIVELQQAFDADLT